MDMNKKEEQNVFVLFIFSLYFGVEMMLSFQRLDNLIMY